MSRFNLENLVGDYEEILLDLADNADMTDDGTILYNTRVRAEFQSFFERSDSFALGVCNGCQLEALLGWVPWRGIEDHLQPQPADASELQW